MNKLIATAAAALFVAAPAFAQTSGNPMQLGAHLSKGDLGTVTALRIKVVKAALQLTPQQEKFWPAIEQAIRTRAEHRQTRLARVAEAMATTEKGHGSVMKTLSERNPVEFMHERANALAQRAQDLNKLADAWRPLYATLKPEQKQRLAFLRVSVLRGMHNRLEQRLLNSDEDIEE